MVKGEHWQVVVEGGGGSIGWPMAMTMLTIVIIAVRRVGCSG